MKIKVNSDFIRKMHYNQLTEIRGNHSVWVIEYRFMYTYIYIYISMHIIAYIYFHICTYKLLNILQYGLSEYDTRDACFFSPLYCSFLALLRFYLLQFTVCILIKIDDQHHFLFILFALFSKLRFIYFAVFS